jgi:hypothetical protein
MDTDAKEVEEELLTCSGRAEVSEDSAFENAAKGW